MSREKTDGIMHFTYFRCKLQSTRKNVTRMATIVRLASQHVLMAHDDSGLFHSADAKLSLPCLGITDPPRTRFGAPGEEVYPEASQVMITVMTNLWLQLTIHKSGSTSSISM